MEKIKVGNDNGNSEQKIVINGELIKQPNVYTKITRLPNLDELNPSYIAKNITNNLIVTIESASLNNGAAATYLIGNNAISSGKNLRNIEVGTINSKLESDVPIVNTLAQIAGYVAKKIILEKKENREIQVDIDMTTGLPINQYTKEKAKVFANRFIGKHKVIVFLGNERVEVKLVFEYVKVLPEATPSIFYLQNNKLLGYEDIDFKDKKILHISIGDGTTEYPLTVDVGFNPLFITGSNNGVGHAINNVLLTFMQQKSLSKYTRQDFSEVLKNKTHKYNDLAMDIIENELEDQAFIISAIAKQELGKANNEVDYILVYGGGSVLMREYIEKELDKHLKKTGVKLIYVPESLAIDIESLGMYEFCKGEIFEKLKEKFISKK